MPEETGTPTVYDTSERDGRYVSIRKNPEKDALQLHTDSVTPGENLKTQIGRSNGDSKRPIDTTVYLTRETFGSEVKMFSEHYLYYRYTGTMWNRHKGTPKPEVIQKPADFLPEDTTAPGPSS